MESLQENILNVTLLEPRKKHPAIFAKFDELAAGEDLIIHNDHDPKPLYYQLLGERGNIFDWEYLQEGPECWKVRISRKISGDPEQTLGEIAARDLRKAEIFKKYGLDFCCGGKKTVREACADKGIDATRVEQELKAAEKIAPDMAGAQPLPYNDWPLDFLADYVVNTHHSYVRKSIPDLLDYAHKVTQVHGQDHPELRDILPLVKEVCNEMTDHMKSEEEIVFPYVKQVFSRKNENAFTKYDTIKTPIELMEAEHDFVGRRMEKIRQLSNNYTLPPDGCASYSYLFKKLEEFENDLFTHIHLENNIMFPKALALEDEIKTTS